MGDHDVVAVTGSGLGPTSVRELGWQLEGTGRGLVVENNYGYAPPPDAKARMSTS